MTYPEALAWLQSIEGLGIKLGLGNITRVLEGLGDPQRRFASVLVAGSNGKGSVAAMLESILRSAGHATGLYTSPHLIRFEERILVRGRPVAAGTFAAAVGRVRDATADLMRRGALEAHPTHFEVLTAAAFEMLAGAGVEVAVLEVGMGGRLDATVLAGPRLAVLTNVSLEHTRWLGESIGAIAREKAGVLLPGGTLLAAERSAEALQACRARAAEVGGRLVELDRFARAAPGRAPAPHGSALLDVTTERRRHEGLRIGLAGAFQERNAVVAVAAADLLDAMGIALPAGSVRAGLAGVRWPGRLQVLEGGPRIVLDGAHNPAACAGLRQALAEMGASGATLLFGVLRDKDWRGMLEQILPAAGRLVLTRGASQRFHDPWRLASSLRREGVQADASADPAEGLGLARGITPEGGTICVTGSLYLVGDMMAHLGIEPWPAEVGASDG